MRRARYAGLGAALALAASIAIPAASAAPSTFAAGGSAWCTHIPGPAAEKSAGTLYCRAYGATTTWRLYPTGQATSHAAVGSYVVPQGARVLRPGQGARIGPYVLRAYGSRTGLPPSLGATAGGRGIVLGAGGVVLFLPVQTTQ